MLRYLKLIRWKVTPQKDEFLNLLFLTSTGNQFKRFLRPYGTLEWIMILSSQQQDYIGRLSLLRLMNQWMTPPCAN